MLNLDKRLPVERGRVLNDIDLQGGITVEDDIKPVVLPEPLRRLVFVGSESDFSDGSPPPHLDRSLRVFRVRMTGNQIETAIVGLDARDFPPPVPAHGRSPPRWQCARF